MPKKRNEYTEAETTEAEWNAEENPWYQKAQQTAETLLNRPAFTYDPGADPLWLTAKDQYTRLGKRAMEDVMGQTAALSGGYASSYAQTQGQQAYADRIARLAELLPDYYEQARSAYERETGALRDDLGTVLGLYDKDYEAWLDRQSARERAAKQDRSDQTSERSYAYRMAMLALQHGLRVSDALLTAAGIDPAYAETIRRYYANQNH